MPGDEFVRVPMLCRDGARFEVTARDHTRIRITAVPDGRRRKYRYVKVDPQPMGNGRPDRTEHTTDRRGLDRHYLPADVAGIPAACPRCEASFTPSIGAGWIKLACRSCGHREEYDFNDRANRWESR